MAIGLKENLLEGRQKEDEKGKIDLRGRIKQESKDIWRIAFPGIISRVSFFGTLVATQSFIGRVSDVDLAAFALVQTLNLRFQNGILLGMSSATETLCAQSFGAGQHGMMGIYLQRSWIVNFSTATIILPIFLFSTQIFRFLGMEEALATKAGYMSLWILPFAFSNIFSMTMQMYLQSQLKNTIVACLTAAQFVIHIFLSWVFVCVLNLGVAGAMGALTISAWFTVIGEFVYITGGWCPTTWRGFTFAAFKDLWPVIKLSVSSGVMLCLELWYTSILVLLAGYMQNAEVSIAAFSICLNINVWELMINIGFVGAACVRVANELGKGNAEGAKFSIKVLLGTSISIGLVFFALCLAFSSKIGYLFTSEVKVAETVSDLSIFLSLSVLLNSIYPVLSGVAVGAGLQGTVAVISLCCYYVLGIPVGAILGYIFHMEAKSLFSSFALLILTICRNFDGAVAHTTLQSLRSVEYGIWIGMLCGVVAQTLGLVILTWRTNWDNEVTKASDRLKRWYVKSSDASDETPQIDGLLE